MRVSTAGRRDRHFFRRKLQQILYETIGDNLISAASIAHFIFGRATQTPAKETAASNGAKNVRGSQLRYEFSRRRKSNSNRKENSSHETRSISNFTGGLLCAFRLCPG